MPQLLKAVLPVSIASYMTTSNELANRFREVILNGTWIANTNYKQQLDGLRWEMATAKLDSFNTISVLAQHIHYYIAGLIRVFKGGSLDIRDQYSFDFPPVQSQEEWDTFLTRFYTDAEDFATLVAQLPAGQLDEVFVEEKYGTYRRNIDGMIEHSYYHLGQLVLLKKMLSTDPRFTPAQHPA